MPLCNDHLCAVKRFHNKNQFSLLCSLRPRLSWTALTTKCTRQSWIWSKLLSSSRMTSPKWSRSSTSPSFRCTNLSVVDSKFKVYEKLKTSWVPQVIDVLLLSLAAVRRDGVTGSDPECGWHTAHVTRVYQDWGAVCCLQLVRHFKIISSRLKLVIHKG